jgi:Kef-type K+ transport system membrane component KefB
MPPAFLIVTDAAKIPLAILLVFGTAKLLAELFERLGQPGIVGEIFAGILLGPSVLHWVAPTELLSTLADFGVMFLLFRVGLDVKASSLLKVGGTATIVATAGVIVPMIFGWGIVTMYGYPQIEAVFVGASMVATSVGITASVLSAKGLLHLQSSQIILAAAVIDDVLGLLVLAVVSSMARGSLNVLDIALTTLLAAGFVAVIAKWGTHVMGMLVPRLQQSLRLQEAEFAVSLILLFSLSLLAIYAGVAAIVGAFMAGMALSESTPERVKDLASGASELLVPFFLVGIGLHVDLLAFKSPALIVLLVVILAAAVVSKFLGCGLGAFRLGKKEAVRIGCGMVPRGEVGMVVAQLGLTLGVISQPIYGVVVGMAVLTTIVAPSLLNFAYKNEPRFSPHEVYSVR